MKKVHSILMFIILVMVTMNIHVFGSEVRSYTFNNLISIEDEGFYYQEFVIQMPDGSIQKGYNVNLQKTSNFSVVTHDLLFGENAKGLSTVMEIALDYEQRTGKVVYAAINGDYFSGGLPVDFYAKDNNILRIGPYSSTLGKNSFGFDNLGNHSIGKVEYGYKIMMYDTEYNYLDYVHIDKINETLGDGEVGIYTYNKKQIISGDNVAKINVTLDEIYGNYSFPLSGIVTKTNDFTFSDDSYSYTYKDFIIAAKGDSESFNTIKNSINNEGIVEVYPYPINAWFGMNSIIGGWQVLLKQGQLLPDELHTGWNTEAPRTSIGIKQDGTIGFTVTDGRLVDYPGLTIEEQAYVQQDLNYYSSLELDGGGSSTFLLRDLDTNTLKVMNTPSDGSLRKVANAVLIVGDAIDTEPIVIEQTCDENPDQEKCVSATPNKTTCENGYQVINKECVLISKDDTVTTTDTGCFSIIAHKSAISLLFSSFIGSIILFFKRKN